MSNSSFVAIQRRQMSKLTSGLKSAVFPPFDAYNWKMARRMLSKLCESTISWYTMYCSLLTLTSSRPRQMTRKRLDWILCCRAMLLISSKVTLALASTLNSGGVITVMWASPSWNHDINQYPTWTRCLTQLHTSVEHGLFSAIQILGNGLHILVVQVHSQPAYHAFSQWAYSPFQYTYRHSPWKELRNCDRYVLKVSRESLETSVRTINRSTLCLFQLPW